MNNKPSILPAIIIALCALALVLAFASSAEPISQDKQYCEMVQIWNQTNGEHGWPDYNNNAEEICYAE